MDDVALDRAPQRDVSCRSLLWCFDLCEQKSIDPERILRRVPYSVDHLKDPSQFIDWASYATFISNLHKYLNEDELLAAGRSSWQSANLKLLSLTGRLLFSVKDQYLAMFGPMGEVARTFPVNLSMEQVDQRRIKITLAMARGRLKCQPFQTILAGQMIGLPESLGLPPATVDILQSDYGAVYDISYSNEGGLLAPLRKAIMWLFTARETARELSSTYDDLLVKYHELQEETAKLRQAEKEVQISEERYRLLAANVNDIIWTMNIDLQLDYISPAVLPITGYNETELLSLSLDHILDQESLTRVRDAVDRGLSNDEFVNAASTVEIGAHHKDGHKIWLEVKASFLFDDDQNPVSIIGVARDITERKKMEGRLSEQETSYQVITNTAQDAIITIDQKNLINFANPASVQIFGYDVQELMDMDIALLMPEALGDPRLRELYRPKATEPRSGVTAKGLRKDRTLIPLELSFVTHEISGATYRTFFARDISARARNEQERKQLEQQLQASQKMESIGQLTVGIAHDFNNLLVAILGYADLAMSEAESSALLNNYLSEIKLAGERAADMTQKLLAFSRRQIIEPKLIDVNELLDGIDLMINRLLPENIDVNIERAPLEALPVMADAGQLEQVLINLAVNARDAMAQGGRLSIRTFRQTLDDDFLQQHTFARPGEHVIIRVTDTGAGMSPEIQKRIFEPFFTTKPEGAGTGLGLAVVFGIVKQHNGFIDLDSTLGQGTIFTIYLPVATEVGQSQTPDRVRHVEGGHETICIVEDNTQVRNLARLILRGAGYDVIEAVDGLDAIEKFESYKHRIDLILMDVVMPRMGGKEVMEKLLQIKPDLKILFTSGYSESGIHTNFILESGLEFIPKPYNTDALRSRVRAILDGHKDGGRTRMSVN
jgi:PAS domain S-box-containing protein